MHTTDDDILLYLENKLSPERRHTLEAHVGRCKDCAGQFAELARLPNLLKQEIPFKVDERTLKKAIESVKWKDSGKGWSQRLFRSPLRVALAPVCIVVISLTLYLLIPRRESSQFRSTESETTTPTMYPSDGAVVHEKTPMFRWSPMPQTSAYRFSLMDENGVIVRNWDIRDTSLVLPPTVTLVPGKIYLWSVESFLADKTLGRSALHAFTYAPPQ